MEKAWKHDFQQENQEITPEAAPQFCNGNNTSGCSSPEWRSSQPHLTFPGLGEHATENSQQLSEAGKNSKCPIPPDEAELEMFGSDTQRHI